MPHSVSASASAFPDPSNREALLNTAFDAARLARTWKARGGAVGRFMHIRLARCAARALRLAKAPQEGA